MKKVDLITEEFYHIYNRGVDKRDIFISIDDYYRFLRAIREFNTLLPIGSLYEKKLLSKKLITNGDSISTMEIESPCLVEVIAYCLMPNHFHIILRQKEDKGIEKYMHRIGVGYTMYFNQKNERSGSLFQGRYKARHIDSPGMLSHLSVYVNCNFKIHGYTGEEYAWSSLQDYLGKRNGSLCNKSAVLNQFKGIEHYNNFMEENLVEIKDIRNLKKMALME